MSGVEEDLLEAKDRNELQCLRRMRWRTMRRRRMRRRTRRHYRA
jgi:hypothetical protein